MLKTVSIKTATDEWIKDARKVWGTTYDYSKVEYKNLNSSVTVICPKHGPWACNPGNHIAKAKPRGCPACGRERQIRKATKKFNDFVRDARAIHSDRYEYDPEAYKNARLKTKIICPVHGAFMQTPDAHISQKAGCPQCAQELITQQQRLPIEELNRRLAERSGNRVTIVPQSYRGFNYHADFICSKHGQFTRLVNSTVTGNPCLLCSKEEGVYLKHSTESFQALIRSKFGDKYELENVEYKGRAAPITLVCEKHGPFTIQAGSLYRSPGCPKCAYEASADTRRHALTQKAESTVQDRYDQWLDDARNVHGNKYDYSLVDYKTARRKVDIICPVHGVFQQTPDTHLSSGCRKCADEDLKGRYAGKYFEEFPERKDLPAILYYLEFKQGDLLFYKVGITTTTIGERFSVLHKTNVDYAVLGEHRTTLFEAFTMEQEIQQSHGDKYRYIPELESLDNRAIRIGPTECFSKKLTEHTRKRYFS